MPDANSLSASERLTLIQTLNALPMAQFEMLVIALNPPAGILPPNFAAQGNRAPELLRWVEGPTGPKMPELQAILDQILNGGQGLTETSRSHVESPDPGTKQLSASRQRFYQRQKTQLEEELVAVEADLATAPREVDRLRLEKEAERLLEKIEALENKLQVKQDG